MKNPTYISLFSGAGGMDIGLERAGFTCLAATDFEKACIDTLKAAKAMSMPDGRGGSFLASAKIVHGDISSLKGSDLSCSTPDMVVGGPPCQPFSSAGKMLALDDPRGRLFEHFARIVDEISPRFVLLENVRGIVTAKDAEGVPGGVLRLVKETFEGIGYKTRFGVLNAADYGAPQSRARLIMIGDRKGTPPEFPQATHGPASEYPSVSLGEFLRRLPPCLEEEVVRPTAAAEALLAPLKEGTGVKSMGAKETTRPGGHWGYRQGMFMADTGKPARTVTASAAQDWIRDELGRLRRISMSECAAIQGFPEGWPFQGSKAAKFKQIGNAVPSILSEVVGRKIAAAISDHCEGGESAAIPKEFLEAIKRAEREWLRNGASRSAARGNPLLKSAGRV